MIFKPPGHTRFFGEKNLLEAQRGLGLFRVTWNNNDATSNRISRGIRRRKIVAGIDRTIRNTTPYRRENNYLKNWNIQVVPRDRRHVDIFLQTRSVPLCNIAGEKFRDGR